MALLGIGVIWLGLVWWTWRRDRTHAHGTLRHRDLLAGGLLFALTLGFFWRTLSGDVYQPADGGDLVSFLFPTYRFAAAQLSQGVLPLWNPHLYGGAPFIADIQAGFLYWPNLLLFLLWPAFPYVALQWLAIGHLFWAGLGMYVLLRTLRWGEWGPVSRPAALFGALAFQFCDPLLIHLGNLNLIAVLSWLPWVMAAFHRALAEHNLRWAALAGLLFALANYAGHAQSSLYIGLALVIYAVVWSCGEIGGQRAPRRLETGGVPFGPQSLVLTLLIAGLLTAPILLPALELTGYSTRGEFSYQESVNFSLAPTQLIGLVTPGFFGHGPALHWGLWERVETPFAGVAALILALAGIALADGATRRRLWPWLVIALFGLVSALGVYAILHGWLTWLLPIVGQLRAPARGLILWTFALAVLAGLGLELVCYRWRAARTLTPADPHGRDHKQSDDGVAALDFILKAGALLLGVVFTPLLYLALLLTQADPTAFLRASVAALAITLAAACWLATWALIAARRAGWIGSGLCALLLIAVLYFDLSAAGAYTDISPSDPTEGFHHPEIAQFLHDAPGRFRIDSDTDIAALWQPDTAALYGLEDLGGVANPLTLRHWQELLAASGGRQSRLYDMLNGQYVVARDETPLPEGKFELAFDAPGELAVYRNLTVLPRAWLVHEAEQLDQAGQAVAIKAPDFDPTQRVLIAAALGDLAPSTGAEAVTVQASDVNHLRLQAQTTAPAYLVLSEVWYPGWRALVNGAPVALVWANGGLRALYLPAGEAQVELRFVPFTWRLGLGGLAIGVLLLVFVSLTNRSPRLLTPP